MTTTRAKRVKKSVKRDLTRIVAPEEAVEVIEEIKQELETKVEETPKGRVPGLTIGGSKTTYTYQDLVKIFPVVSFIPEETIRLTYQGVPVQAFSGIEMHVPKCFKDIYDRHRFELRQHSKNVKEAGLLDLGVGELPPEEVY